MKTRQAPVLVTGATGFLGRHLLEALGKTRPQTRALALVKTESDWARQDWTSPLRHAETIEGRVTGPDAWLKDARLEGLSGIYHLAAVVKHSRRDTAEVYETNIEGTLRMVRLAAEKRCRMVFVSTSGTVGCFKTARESADEDAPYAESTVGQWPYYDSKIKAERAARALASELGVELVIVRPPVLLGPGDHRFRSTGNVVRFLRKRLPFLIQGGINFTDIRDAAPAIIAAMAHPVARPVYHLEGTSCSIDAFFRMCEEVSGVAAPTRKLPHAMAWALASASERAAHTLKTHPPLPDPVVVEMASRWWGLSSRFSAGELGYSARAPRQTLADTVHWLRENHPQLKA
jgi:dihydroflavonol-4-reductase